MFPCCFSADKKLRKIWGHWKWLTKAWLSIRRCIMRSLRILGSKPGNREVISHYFVRFLNDKYIDLKKNVNNARNRWVIIGSHIIAAGVCRNRPGCAILPRRSIFALGGSHRWPVQNCRIWVAENLSLQRFYAFFACILLYYIILSVWLFTFELVIAY